MRKLGFFRRNFATAIHGATNVPLLVIHKRVPLDLLDIRNWLTCASDSFNNPAGGANSANISAGIRSLLQLKVYTNEVADILSTFIAVNIRDIATKDLTHMLRMISDDGSLAELLRDEIATITHELRSSKRLIDMRDILESHVHLDLLRIAHSGVNLDARIISTACDLLARQVPYLTGPELCDVLKTLSRLKVHHTAFLDSVVYYLPIVWVDDSLLQHMYELLCALVEDPNKIAYIHDFLKFRLATVEVPLDL